MFREELDISNTGFESEFSNFLSKKELVDRNIISSVSKIIEKVSIRGDEALIDITKKLDSHILEDFFISEIVSKRDWKYKRKEIEKLYK